MRFTLSTRTLVHALLIATIAACSSAGATSLGGGAGGSGNQANGDGGGDGSGAGGEGDGAGGDGSVAGSSGNASAGNSGGPNAFGGGPSASGGAPSGGTTGSGGAWSTAGAPATGGTTSAGGTTSGGGATGTGGQAQGKSLYVLPANALYSPPAGVPVNVKFTAHEPQPGMGDLDVTGQTAWAVEPPGFGTWVGNELQVPADYYGTATIKAAADGLMASTTLTITPEQIVMAPGVDPNAKDKFNGPDDPNAKPELVYPADGVLVPPNMNSLEIHWKPAPGQTLFKLKFVSPTVALTVYAPCTPLGGGCVYTPDAVFWGQLASGNRGKAAVTYAISGTDGNGGPVGTSALRAIQFASTDIQGGIYYWNDGGSIMRYDFGLPMAPPEVFVDIFSAGGATCVGCHAISRNGAKLAFGMNIPAPAPYKVWDVASKTMAYPAPAAGANFFAFSPDGNYLLASDGIKTWLNDANTGAVLANPWVPLGTMPDWSANGNLVVFAKPQSPPPFGIPVPGIDSAQLELVSYDGTNWQPPKTIVPFTGANNYYPAISPDNSWVLFNRSPTNRNSFDNAATNDAGQAPDGEIWVVSKDGGNPLRLDTATLPGDSWPKWAPNADTYEKGLVMWYTVSSRRPYGLRPASDKAQLWMVAFDPQKGALGQDPSLPAFWLPFQASSSGNHIAQWVTKVERKACKSDVECDVNQMCSSSMLCIPKPK